MKKTEAVRIAEIQRESIFIQEAGQFVRNPIVIALAVFVAVEALQKKGYMGENVGTMLETAAIATPVMTEAYKSGALEHLSKVPGDILEGIGKITNIIG